MENKGISNAFCHNCNYIRKINARVHLKRTDFQARFHIEASFKCVTRSIFLTVELLHHLPAPALYDIRVPVALGAYRRHMYIDLWGRDQYFLTVRIQNVRHR